MATYIELIAKLENDINILNQILVGDENTEVELNGETRGSIQKSISDQFSSLRAMAQGRVAFENIAQMFADLDHPANTLAEVWNDAPNNNGIYGKIGNTGLGSWQKSDYDNISGVTNDLTQLQTQFALSDAKFDIAGINLINQQTIRAGYYFSPASEAIKPSPPYRMTGFIPVEEGKTYTFSGYQVGAGAGALFSSQDDNAYVQGTGGRTFTVPTGLGIQFFVGNITNSGSDDTSYDFTVQLEEGFEATEWQPYKKLPLKHIEGYERLIKSEDIDQFLPSKVINLYDIKLRDTTRRYSPGSKSLVGSDSVLLISSGYIAVEEGKTYSFGGEAFRTSASGGFFTANNLTNAVENIDITAVDGGWKFLVPTGLGIKYLVLNIASDLAYTEEQSYAQLNEGAVLKPYTSHKAVRSLKPEYIPQPEEFGDNFIFESASKNLIDLTKVNYTHRYSTGQKRIIADTLGIASSDYLPVKPGEFYTVSGNGLYSPWSPQAGFFADKTAAAIDNIAFFDSVDGEGKVFKVPEDSGVKYVVISLQKKDSNPSAIDLDGDVQLELGEQASEYSEFKTVTKIKQSYLPDNTREPSSNLSVADFLLSRSFDAKSLHADKLPEFRRNWLSRDKDLTVVSVGTSLTARSTEHCTTKIDGHLRPPLFHSNNFASLLWDRLKWEGQEYRRYDSGHFSEVGNFYVSSSLAEWDDGIYRHGLTKYSNDNNVSISFEVPINAWQFNFIYRTDTVACEAVTLSVAQGLKNLEVFDELTQQWVEAHNYVFSMRESAPVARTIAVPKSSDDTVVNREIESKGNTTYQKRLKMRAKGADFDTRNVAKTLTLTGDDSGRFMYWGCEWSVRQYMITFINAARGSHNSQAEGLRGLPRFADNEVFSFKPDLLFFELPIHNDGAANANPYPGGYWSRLTENYVFNPDYELALKTRAAYFGLNPEIGMFTSSISWNFGGIDDEGQLKILEQNDGKMMSALDKYNEAYTYVMANHPDALFINAAARWVDAAFTIFGDLKSATVGSGRDGSTFTNEGSHWNDTGSKVIAKFVVPVFDF